uniref:High density lipoprotein-binding protein n=1 Tax=Cyclopterus lumpus TaxID=8103 RepID=A0A8C2ZQ80_CYCLU
MSSVAVLTPESFAEHRSGLKDQEMTGCVPEDEAYIPTYLEAFPPLPEKGAPGEKTGEPASAWGGKIRPIKASVITQVFHVPLEERRYKDNSQFGEGEEAKVCLDIMQRTGAHIELSLAKDQGLSIMVTGKLESVMKARKEIVARLQTQASATVAIPKEHHRFVIGKNGEKLQELELKTATKIAIPRPDDPSANIRITGTKEGIEKARHEILLISAEQDKRAVERLCLEKAFHPFIAGAHNRLVQELSQETGARISIPPPSLPRDEIVITGEKEAVALALSRIRAIYDDKKRKTTTISVEVKKSQHKYIIGPKGNTLQEILETTGVSVEMPPLDSGSETIILRGEPDKLGPALTQVYAKAKSVMVVEVTAPAWLHRFIIGKKGQNIGRITQQLPRVHIEFTDGEERISLEGPTAEVEQAQAQIQEIIKDLVSTHTLSQSVINRIKEQYKVSVRIPQDSERSGLVRIEGDPKGVQLARRELIEMVQRMENERTKDLIVEQKLHRSIIGQKGEKIKEVRDKFPEVIINFPDPSQKSDIVQLRGPKNEVEKCGKFLQKIIADLIENSFSLSVPIFKQFHKNIIGKGGANIKKIREETNTKIDLPTENSNSEMIVITGKKSNCEAARDRILSIQRELANIKEAEVAIPARLHNSLIGSKGCLVRSIMEDCSGVHIHFPSEGSGSDKVTIRGPVGEVEKAKKQLLQLAEEKQVNNFTAELQAKPEYHKFLIGRGGANIRRVRDKTGARIIFPSPDDTEQELITIVGKEEAVRQAQKELECLVKNLVVTTLHYSFGQMFVILSWMFYFSCIFKAIEQKQSAEFGNAKCILQKKTSNIFSVVFLTISLPRCCGLPLQDDVESQVSVEVAIPQRYHRAIMGPKGCRIQLITREHEVQIKFPERDDSLAGQTQITREKNISYHYFLFELQIATSHHRISQFLMPGNRREAPPQENGDVSPEAEFVAPKCDIITIAGRAEKCEPAKAALLALRSFKVILSVDPKFHPKIIGRKGAVISQIRKDHDVSIQFPDKGDEQQDAIVILGYERNVEEASQAIQQLVAEWQEMVSRDVHLDPRTHARIIGARGKAIRKLMEEFKVDIRFPQPGSDEPDKVAVTGLPEAVDNAIDHLLNLEEEYMLSVTETETLAAYMKPPSRYGGGGGAGVDDSSGGPAKGFVVLDAPWNAAGNKAPDMSSAEDFPTFGMGVAPKQASAWGPKKF